MRVPVPHSLPPNFCLPEKECNAIDAPLHLSRLPLEKWLDGNAVSKLLIENATATRLQTNRFLTSSVSDLNKDELNQFTKYNLVNYCSNVIDYYKTASNKKAF
jgi:hypothetical protein